MVDLIEFEKQLWAAHDELELEQKNKSSKMLQLDEKLFSLKCEKAEADGLSLGGVEIARERYASRNYQSGPTDEVRRQMNMLARTNKLHKNLRKGITDDIEK